jgi:hypothetical protein
VEELCGEGGELRAQKRCGSKPPLMTPQSCAYSTSNLRATCGSLPLGVEPRPDPEEKSVNERKRLVVETSTHSINRKHGGFGRGDRRLSAEVPQRAVFPAGPY